MDDPTYCFYAVLLRKPQPEPAAGSDHVAVMLAAHGAALAAADVSGTGSGGPLVAAAAFRFFQHTRNAVRTASPATPPGSSSATPGAAIVPELLCTGTRAAELSAVCTAKGERGKGHCRMVVEVAEQHMLQKAAYIVVPAPETHMYACTLSAHALLPSRTRSATCPPLPSLPLLLLPSCCIRLSMLAANLGACNACCKLHMRPPVSSPRRRHAPPCLGCV